MKISPWATGVMKVAVFSAAFAIPGTGIAMAAGPISTTSGNGSILGGNQINVPVSAPVDICGNAAGILGLAGAGCDGGASVSNGGGSGGSGGIERTSGNGSKLGGNQVNAPVSTPVDVCGNSVAAHGGAFSSCRGGASVGGTNRARGAGWRRDRRPELRADQRQRVHRGRQPGQRPGQHARQHLRQRPGDAR